MLLIVLALIRASCTLGWRPYVNKTLNKLEACDGLGTMLALYTIFPLCNAAYDQDARNFLGIAAIGNTFLNIFIHLGAIIISQFFELIIFVKKQKIEWELSKIEKQRD